MLKKVYSPATEVRRPESGNKRKMKVGPSMAGLCGALSRQVFDPKRFYQYWRYCRKIPIRQQVPVKVRKIPVW